jgi:hypothetical protein
VKFEQEKKRDFHTKFETFKCDPSESTKAIHLNFIVKCFVVVFFVVVDFHSTLNLLSSIVVLEKLIQKNNNKTFSIVERVFWSFALKFSKISKNFIMHKYTSHLFCVQFSLLLFVQCRRWQ